MTQFPKTVTGFLLARLTELGVKHVFGIPGESIVEFMDAITHSDIAYVGCCNELNVGYAATGYAKVNGVGVACLAYNVGSFSAVNAFAGAVSEKIPVIMIAGCSRLSVRNDDSIIRHHDCGHYNKQYEVFAALAKRAISMTNTTTDIEKIDEALRYCITEKEPIFIEIPPDLVTKPCEYSEKLFPNSKSISMPTIAPDIQDKIKTNLVNLLSNAKRPLIWAGAEIDRYEVKQEFLELLKVSGLPFVTEPLSKTVVPETHPQFYGVYWGQLGTPELTQYVEQADILINLGAWLSALNTGYYTAKLPKHSHQIIAAKKVLSIGETKFDNVFLKQAVLFLIELFKNGTLKKFRSIPEFKQTKLEPYKPQNNSPITLERFYQRLSSFIDDSTLMVVEPGESAFFNSMNMRLKENCLYVGQGIYQSIGYGIPAALGAGIADAGERRMIVLSGDGAFQLSCQEMANIYRNNLNAIIFVFNNDGYLIQRAFHDGPFNNILQWRYHLLPKVFADDFASYVVKDELELEKALQQAQNNKTKPTFIEVIVEKKHGAAVERLGNALLESFSKVRNME